MTRDDLVEAMAEAVWNTKDGSKNWSWMALIESDKDYYRKDLRAALSALESLGIALVPVEPTQEMRYAAVKFWDDRDAMWLSDIYFAFLSASPLRKTEGGEE